ncbi:unnamed protein product, partial [Meganyctiphanes norvegica]
MTSKKVMVGFKSGKKSKTAPGFSCTIGPKKDEALSDDKEDSLTATAKPVPCQESGGQIQQQKCCPWWSGSQDDCVKYDACVCKDGFEGDECEHDCNNNICPEIYDPVCG